MMLAEEAIRWIERIIPPGRDEDFKSFMDALTLAAEALRSLDRLEKFLEGKLSEARKWKNWPMIMKYEEIIKVLKGETHD